MKGLRRLALWGTLVAALLVATGGSSGAGDPLTWDIYVVSSTGGARRALTSTHHESQPSVSPDGRLIAYSSSDGIRLMNADGGEQRSLPAGGERPLWSPHGRTLVYTAENWDACFPGPAHNCVVGEVWRVGADGSGARRLFYAGVHPLWSPKGRWLLFRDFVVGESGGVVGALKVASPDGSQLRKLYGGESTDGLSSPPSWSPDGKWIAFTIWRGQQDRLFVIRADGSHLRRLTTGLYPAWSPNGKLIAFQRDVRIGQTWRTGVWVIPVTGGRARRISSDGRCPTWSPRGKRIAFLTNGTLQDGEWRRSLLVVMRPDGHGRRVLAEAIDCYKQGWAETAPPAWSPDGRWLYFGG